jgi:hypothetical protein
MLFQRLVFPTESKWLTVRCRLQRFLRLTRSGIAFQPDVQFPLAGCWGRAAVEVANEFGEEDSEVFDNPH